DFWRLIGLYIAEGHVGADGARRRVTWSFHPSAEQDLVDFVADYWRRNNVKVDVRRGTTTMQVTVSSRILAAWLTEVVGSSCYNKRVPDMVWTSGEAAKQSLLRGLWDGDGSWSAVAGGPSVVFEYGTVSRQLADGMLRLLGDLGVAARLRVGRANKSTVDTYWLSISGAEQLERSLWLFPEHERREIVRRIAGQAKRIAPTGYRRLDPHAAWVRVRRTERKPFDGLVYSLDVPDAHTIVTTAGLVVHNCFPKDTRALVHIAEDAGYDFGLLKGVIQVNDEQIERVTTKVVRMAGNDLDGTVIAVWGLTFKARTDDLRDSPSLEVISRLRKRGAVVRAFDPTVRRELEGIEVCDDPYAACEGAAVLVLLTEWDEFRWVDFGKVRDSLARPVIVDARNLLDPAALRRQGFTYEGVGRS
ncbi:MAG: hypothetical protein JO367_06010, partial [Actinobacteria bacterium]|nr:hypothetical protein [Actinomycetota bacterium]